jgi:hypothetical protein
MSGDSRDRRKEKRLEARVEDRIIDRVTAQLRSQAAPAIELSFWDKVLGVVEHPLVLWIFGILGSIVALIYPPVLFVTILCLVGAVHRTGVVKGQPFWGIQIPTYFTVAVLATGVAGGAIWLIRRNARPALDAIATDVWRYAPEYLKNRGQSITNNYPPPSLPATKPEQSSVEVGIADNDKHKIVRKADMPAPYLVVGGPTAIGGGVALPIAARVTNAVSATNLKLWITRCDSCDWLSLPIDTGVPYGPASPTRVIPLGNLKPGSLTSAGDIRLTVPMNAPATKVRLNYSCDNCRAQSFENETDVILQFPPDARSKLPYDNAR